jgi:hypothetical protein
LGAGVDDLVLRLVDNSGYEWARSKAAARPEDMAIPPTRRAIISSTTSLVIPPGAPPGPYFLKLGIVAPGQEQLLGEFAMPNPGSQVQLVQGPLQPASELTPTTRLDLSLVPAIRLLGYDLSSTMLTPVTPAWLSLYWQAIAPPPDYRVVLRLLNEAGQEVTRWEGIPGQGHYPTTQWRSGEWVKDVWPLQTPADTPLGENYTLAVGLTTPNSSQDASTQPFITQLKILPQPVNYHLPDMQTRLDLNFNNRLTLLGYDLYFDTTSQGSGKLAPIFYWQSQADFEGTFDLRLTLRSADTNQVSQEWQVPLGPGDVKPVWQINEVLSTPYQLDVGPATQGHYNLELALVERTQGQLQPIKLTGGAEVTSTTIEDIQDKMVVRVTDSK